ncbi:MAG TPA: glutamine-hydrolyzing carbamoyl-phosphate synthase small subunit [Bdellovibrionales bacterium]|nr:glutamine-hydrolyzing carbamoyl-phosphate synthase small subunit [Bdellovibrionales bacterium]
MKTEKGFLVLESGEIYPGLWQGGERVRDRAGEVVFNTSHSGYEEMATDPSYFGQILVLTAPQQGNYGENDECWESERIWIEGFVCVEMQNSWRDKSWREKLCKAGVPIMTDVDTRRLVLHLRERGTIWGALVRGTSIDETREKAKALIAEKKKIDLDWVHLVSRKEEQTLKGDNPRGPKIAVLDLGCKTNSLRELKRRCSEVRIFPSRTGAARIREYNPDGILLSNGPGDPGDVKETPNTVRDLLGWKFIFGICMGHQVLGRALGGETYKLKFGHRGSNHPIKDSLLNKIYMSSQNHGYAVKLETLPKSVQVTHVNLNDNTVAGIYDPSRKAMSVQFHPESHPGPHEASELFDFFIRQTQ